MLRLLKTGCYTSAARAGRGYGAVTGTVFEFGDFQLDGESFELRRAGRCLKLERKPMELLILLTERSGHLVTRTEIAERLWEREVFVDTEHGINTAIRKIRQVLGDDPEQPRFVQTITGRGYRFIGTVLGTAPIEAAEPDVVSPVVSPPSKQDEAGPVQPSARPVASPLASQQGKHTMLWVGAMGLLVAAAFLVFAIHSVARSAHARSAAVVPKISSLAVIPLDNFSVESGQEYLADGMTDELTTMLAKNSTLRVISRTSVMQYKGVHRPLREIAKNLGVDGILEGSIARSGDKVHLNIQLIQAATDTHLWAESYDRNTNDLVTLPREAAQTIAKELNSAVVQPSPKYVNPAAYDAYLHGMYLWYRGQPEAYQYFLKATEIQPDYALGWSGLSFYYGSSAGGGNADPQEYLVKGDAASRKAVQLDDTVAQGHLALSAMEFMYRWDWPAAEREIQRAMQLDPGFAEAPHFHAKELAALNRFPEAIAEQKKAMALDPFSRPWAMAMVYVMARQYDNAIQDAHERLVSLPHDEGLYWQLFEAYRRKGMQQESIEMEARALDEMGSKEAAATVRRIDRQGGYKASVLHAIEYQEGEAKKYYYSPYGIAVQYAQLGKREETLHLLEDAYQKHDPSLLWIQTDPAFDFLHADERYRAIIRGIGLPSAY